jgi:tetratricopeptide (TPR) repeat protein
MSYINEALKKAQREKDALYLKYTGILTARGKDKKALSGRLLWVFILGVTGIFLAFGAYSWLNTSEKPIAASAEGAKAQGNRPAVPTSRVSDRVQRMAQAVEPKSPAKPSRRRSAINAQSLYERGEHFRKQGRFKDAKRFYEETLKIDPDHVDALNNLGVIYFSDQDYSTAQRKFEAITRIRPGDVDAYYNLACVHAVKGELRDGLAYLKKAISLRSVVREWAREDPDMGNLHGLPEFEEILKAKR